MKQYETQLRQIQLQTLNKHTTSSDRLTLSIKSKFKIDEQRLATEMQIKVEKF